MANPEATALALREHIATWLALSHALAEHAGEREVCFHGPCGIYSETLADMRAAVEEVQQRMAAEAEARVLEVLAEMPMFYLDIGQLAAALRERQSDPVKTDSGSVQAKTPRRRPS